MVLRSVGGDFVLLWVWRCFVLLFVLGCARATYVASCVIRSASGVSTKLLLVCGMYLGYGGDSSSVASKLSGGVVSISYTKLAFAAIKGDGSVVTWGDAGTRCFVLFLVFLCCGLWLLL